MENVNLSASAYWVPSIASMSYLNYGAAVSEVFFSIHTLTNLQLKFKFKLVFHLLDLFSMSHLVPSFLVCLVIISVRSYHFKLSALI